MMIYLLFVGVSLGMRFTGWNDICNGGSDKEGDEHGWVDSVFWQGKCRCDPTTTWPKRIGKDWKQVDGKDLHPFIEKFIKLNKPYAGDKKKDRRLENKEEDMRALIEGAYDKIFALEEIIEKLKMGKGVNAAEMVAAGAKWNTICGEWGAGWVEAFYYKGKCRCDPTGRWTRTWKNKMWKPAVVLIEKLKGPGNFHKAHYGALEDRRMEEFLDEADRFNQDMQPYLDAANDHIAVLEAEKELLQSSE